MTRRLFVASTGHRSLGKLPQILCCTCSQPSTSAINHLRNMPIGSLLPVNYLWRNCAVDPNPMSPISTTPPESLQKSCRLIHRKSHSPERPTTHIIIVHLRHHGTLIRQDVHSLCWQRFYDNHAQTDSATGPWGHCGK